MKSEKSIILHLFNNLCVQAEYAFPKKREPLEVPFTHGVYVIRRNHTVVHVGRTLRGKKGLYQRLCDHLRGSSSFTKSYLKGSHEKLRANHTFQYLEVKNQRHRALLEAYAIGCLCPKHIGLGNTR